MNKRFPIGARVSVDLFRFDTPQVGTIVKPPAGQWVDSVDDLVCIHFDSPIVSKRYACNDIGRGGRGFLAFSNSPDYEEFTLDMIHSAVLKPSLEATNET